MNITVSTELNPTLAVINGQIKTTSLNIAKHFGKLHWHVIRAIKNLDFSPEFHATNFGVMIIDVAIGKGAVRKDTAYEITKDGFMFLAMGFTGKEAAKWKEAYINAFNAMADQLNPPQLGLKSAPKDKLLHVTPLELSALVDKKVSQVLKGEVLPREPVHNSVTIHLAPLEPGRVRRWLVSQAGLEALVMHTLTPDQEIMTREQLIKQLLQEGYIVLKQTELVARLQNKC